MARPNPVPADDELPQVVNLSNSSAETVQADLVRMHQSGALDVSAEEIELSTSAAGRVRSARVTSHRSLLGAVEAEQVQIDGIAGLVRSQAAGLRGSAGVVLAGTAEVSEAHAGLIAGRDVRAGQVKTVVLLASHVEGEVHTQLDTRGAVIAGTVAGLVVGMLVLAGQALFGRRHK